MKKIIIYSIVGLFLLLGVVSAVWANTKHSMKYYHSQIMRAFNNYDWEKIDKLSDKFIKYYPASEYGYFFKGLAQDELGYHKKAIEYYTKSVEIRPDVSDAYQNRGLAYYNDKQYEKAIADYKKFLELEPDDERVKQQLEDTISAKNGIIIERRGNNTNYRSAKDPLYLAEQYKMMPKEEREAFRKEISADKTIPIYYVAIADDIYKKDKDQAALYYMIGRYRLGQDVQMCTDTSAQAVFSGLPYIAPKTATYVSKMSKKNLAKLFRKLAQWDEQNPARTEHSWVCFHGMEVFMTGTVKTLPEKEFEKIKKESRESLMKNIEKLENNKK